MSQETIVVALDGSDLAARALPHAAAHAKAFDARLLLITVWEGTEPALASALPDVAKDLFGSAHEFYEKYLALARDGLQKQGLAVDTEVLDGQAADEIVRIAKEQQASMLVLASHGRSGVGRWWYGSVTGAVVRRAPVPTLVVGPKVLERRPAQVRRDKILVPLDGSPLAEAALDHAARIAQRFGAQIVLAQAVGWVAQVYLFDMPGASAAQIEQELTNAAEEYLTKTATRFAAGPPVATKVLRGEAADALIDLVDREGIDLIVMTSHGRGGLARAALGSVADRMLQAHAPVLLIRPGA